MAETDRRGLRGLVSRPVSRVAETVVPVVAHSLDLDDLVARLDVDALLEDVDVNALLDRVDVDRVLTRVDPDALLDRVDVDRVLGRVDPNALLDRVDPDALLARLDVDRLLTRVDPNVLLARIDPDALLDRVDPNALLARVDPNALLARVDPNTLLERLDVDRLLARVDVADLAKRAEIGDLVAQSTSQVATGGLDALRRQLVGVDLILHQTVMRLTGRADEPVEPGPPRLRGAVDSRTAKESARLSVSGHYAGVVSRSGAFALDAVAVVAGFGLVLGAVAAIVAATSDASIDAEGLRGIWWLVGLAGWGFVFNAIPLVISGRTPGMAVVGLRLVRSDGDVVGPRRVAAHVVLIPITIVGAVVSVALVLLDRRNRLPHDALSGTLAVYDWGDRSAEMPTPLSRYVERRGAAADPAALEAIDALSRPRDRGLETSSASSTTSGDPSPPPR